MILRTANIELAQLSRQFKVVEVVGPRQSGKTTLVRSQFPSMTYVNFENPDIRLFATQDPRGFLSNYKKGAIFDEIQRVPEIFSYLQQIVDEQNTMGQFIVTGSNNFLLQENISQSLAGRVGYLFLLPLSLQEIKPIEITLNQLLYQGFYPSLYDNPNITPNKWYDNYIRTYIERDVRMIKNITDLLLFEKFVRLLAARIGQLLNMSNLAIEVGVDVKTIQSWIGVLELSFVIFRLKPYHANYNKRLVKMPKIYFFDTGLVCALLNINSSDDLQYHYIKGSLFENMIIIDFLKQRYNRGKNNNLFFWRDNTGNEIDLILDKFKPLPIEIKSGETVSESYFKGLYHWNKISGNQGGIVVYGGDTSFKKSDQYQLIAYHDIQEKVIE
jgi:predicted AAA+ superfamily ATPase